MCTVVFFILFFTILTSRQHLQHEGEFPPLRTALSETCFNESEASMVYAFWSVTSVSHLQNEGPDTKDVHIEARYTTLD